MTRQLDVPKIRSRLSALLSDYRIPSAAIGVLHGETITEFAVGVKNLSSGEPATTDTIYQCGSMTKAWTALTAMQFVEEGLLDLDEPVRTYLPGFTVADPQVSASITSRHLLSHTHGLEEVFGNPGESDDVYARCVDNATSAPQVHPLGHTMSYSPALGYAILARIMEVLDGKPWDEVIKNRLFDPLGLTATSSWREQVDRGRAATGHLIRSLEEGPFVTPVAYLPRVFGPGGNITSTVREVLAMVCLFLTGGQTQSGAQFVAAESIRQMMRPTVAIPDPYSFGHAYGLGLMLFDWHGETVYGHDGNTIGQGAYLRILPDSQIALAMLTNGALRNSFYKKVFNEILTELGAVTIPDLPEPDRAPKLNLSKYEGHYERPGGNRYVVSVDGGRLVMTTYLDPVQAAVLQRPAAITHALLPISDTHFLMPTDDPLEDMQTIAIYDFEGRGARYLHHGLRAHPRVS
ncbi:MAG TPA: serine hydrolase [Ktedonobacterales bacterium]